MTPPTLPPAGFAIRAPAPALDCSPTRQLTAGLNRRQGLLAGLALAVAAIAPAQARDGFDHRHAAWDGLLARHVLPLRGGQASQLRYAGMTADRAALQAYLASLSAVDQTQFQGFSRGQQMAFLINAYNAFTVELILTRWPKLVSIKDLGSFFQSPWKPKWVPLLGSQVSLDDIEHAMLRAPGRYDDPRLHFALNCASIGCPALREQAFVADALDQQLDEQTRRFLADRNRNRYNPASGRLEVSKIFDWFADDFRAGHRGITSLPALLARHADLLADGPADRERIRAQQVAIDFLDYDWRLNGAPAKG